MKNFVIIIGILICSLFLCIRCNPSNNNTSEAKPVQQNQMQHDTTENKYQELRNMALKISPEVLGLKPDNQKVIVHGVVMDWEMEDAVATLVSFSTGDASLYLSSGGGVIGGGQHENENVNVKAKEFVFMANQFIDKSGKAEKTSLPETNHIKFYLLTNKGIYVGEEKIENIENETSKWYPLFVEANNVLAELRIVSEKVAQ